MTEESNYVWRDPGAISKVAVVVLTVGAIAHGVDVILDFGFGPASDYKTATDDLLDHPLQVMHVLADLTLLALLLGAIPLVIWILTVSRNAHTFTKRSIEKPWWAAVWWYLIPIISVYKPYVSMCEIWDVSAPDLKARALNRNVLNIWWMAFIVAGGMAVFSNFGAVYNGIFNLASLIRTVAFIVIVRRVCAMQRQKQIAETFGENTQASVSVLERLNG